MERKFIKTPTGNFNKRGESMHRLLPRFRHKHREPSGLVGEPTRSIRVAA